MTPMTADDSRLNRTESHRFTESRNDEPLYERHYTSAYLPTSSNMDWYSAPVLQSVVEKRSLFNCTHGVNATEHVT